MTSHILQTRKEVKADSSTTLVPEIIKVFTTAHLYLKGMVATYYLKLSLHSVAKLSIVVASVIGMMSVVDQ